MYHTPMKRHSGQQAILSWTAATLALVQFRELGLLHEHRCERVRLYNMESILRARPSGRYDRLLIIRESEVQKKLTNGIDGPPSSCKLQGDML